MSFLARVRYGEMGRSIATIYEDGLIVDKIVGYTRGDCLDSIRTQYGYIRVLDHNEHVIHLHEPVQREEPPGDGSQFDHLIEQICREIALDRIRGRIRPFVEGEHIGCIPSDKRADLR